MTQKLPLVSTKLHSQYEVFLAETDEAHGLILAHLDRILGSPAFRNSRKYSSVLKFVVTKTLDGAPDEIKERTIGVAVFGRPLDYDTTADHVVRSAAGEVRKRLAQYYQEEEFEDSLRIELQPGSYVPQFRLFTGRDQGNRGELLPGASLDSSRVGWSKWLNRKLAVCLGLMVALGMAWGLVRSKEDALEGFWRPLQSSSSPIVICVGDMEGGIHDPQSRGQQPLTMKHFHGLYAQNVHLGDAVTLARIASFLEAHGAQYRVISQSEATFSDFQSSPTVLVGLLNNEWTRRLVSKLRFTIDQSIPEKVIIRDRNAPSRSDWSYDAQTPYLDFTKDYGLILRVVDPKTEQVVVLAGGISVFGTLAAGELLTSPNGIRKLQAAIPSGAGKNVEFVFSTDVIRGKPGHATIVASHSW